MSPLKDWLEADGGLLRLRLARPKANIVDAQMIAALHGALLAHGSRRTLRAVLLDAEGPHFSFGASVEEHLPAQCAAMLGSLHALAGSWVFAAPDAQFAQPEIRLGVFAPAASVLLPYRMNQAAAEDLLLSGRSIAADEALQRGLVRAVADDPEAAALAWYHEHLHGRSAAAVACAMQAARGAMRRDLRVRLAEVERLYLDTLMATRDANEGLVAFLAKRRPNWEHR